LLRSLYHEIPANVRKNPVKLEWDFHERDVGVGLLLSFSSFRKKRVLNEENLQSSLFAILPFSSNGSIFTMKTRIALQVACITVFQCGSSSQNAL